MDGLAFRANERHTPLSMRVHDEPQLEAPEVERLAHMRVLVVRYRAAARRALRLARHYRAEEGSAGGSREAACVAQARAWRRVVRDLRGSGSGDTMAENAGPGLARTHLVGRSDGGRKTG